MKRDITLDTEHNPKYIYKFRDLNNEKHRSILTKNEFFFASFTKFNDPWDSRLPLRYDLMEFNERVKYLFELRRQHEPLEPEEKTHSEALLQAKQFDDPDYVMEYCKSSEAASSKKYGILSFAGHYDRNILWSHYANSHKGICLEFDKQILDKHFDAHFLTHPTPILHFRVEYALSYQEIIPNNDSYDFMFDRFKYKAKEWDYESEHRYILVGKSDVVLQYPNSALLRVILGCAIAEYDRIAVTEIVRSRFPECKVDLAEKQFGTFDLKLKSII